MGIRKIIGWVILLSPFVALFIFATIAVSFIAALTLFAIVAALVFFIWLGVQLITD